MDVLDVVIRALHFAFASVWFGNKLGLPSDMRETIRDMDGPEDGLVRRLRRSVGMDIVGAAGVAVTGGLLVYRLGVGEVDLLAWAGAAVALGIVVVAILVTTPARRGLRTALAAGKRPEAIAAANRVSAAMNIEGFMWLAALVLMLL